MASAAIRRGGLQQEDCGLCALENVYLPLLLLNSPTYNFGTTAVIWLCREEDAEVPHGHVTSLAVLRSHRKLGLATKLMRAAQQSMVEAFGGKHCSLHVRKSNMGAIHLYTQTLGYEYVKEPPAMSDGDMQHQGHSKGVLRRQRRRLRDGIGLREARKAACSKRGILRFLSDFYQEAKAAAEAAAQDNEGEDEPEGVVQGDAIVYAEEIVNSEEK